MDKIIVNGFCLDEEQLKPIVENPKYSLIVAGAGSGKTLTLIGKIKYVLIQKFFCPEEICCISFTNESVNQMRQNILKNCGVEIPTFTFHKLALEILKQANQEFTVAPSSLLEDVINEFFQTKCFGNKKLQNLVYQKFSFSFLKGEATWKKILFSKDFQKFHKTIFTFIQLMKANGYQKKDFQKFFQTKKYQNTLLLIYAIFLLYETEKNSAKMIDFDDMMTFATNALREAKCTLPYKLIIIDEFQDTSMSRFQLIQEIVKQNNSSLCVVGDDYQSIYRFSGCDLNLFLHFSDYYPDARIYKLERTYRNSAELITTAGQFILKNPTQIKKELISFQRLEKPIILVFFKSYTSVLNRIIKEIPEDKEILILARNHFDLNAYTNSMTFQVIGDSFLQFQDFPKRKIRFLTIHKSKGLESDVVIFLNVKNDIYGMPSKLKEEEILSFVKSEQYFPFEEERRLFYVALTRTKSVVYLLIPKKEPSIFVKELKHQKNVSKKYV